MADENDIDINIGSNPAGVESGSRRAKTAVGSVTKEAKDLDAALRRLKSSIDPTFAATEKYNKALADNQRLLQAGRISQEEYAAGARAAKQALDDQITSINRSSSAAKAAAAEQKAQRLQAAADARRQAQEEAAAARSAAQAAIAAARQERAEKARLEAQERAAIKLAAQLARQSAVEAARASRPVSQRAIGPVAPGSIDATRTIKQLENDISRATSKLANLTAQAEAAATRAAESSSVKIAQIAQATADRRAQAAQETRDRIISMERQIASQQGALAESAAAEQKAARAQEIADAKAASAAAVQAAKDKRAADASAAASAKAAAAAVRDQARAEAESAASLHEFRASLDPVYAAQTRYNQTMARATALLMQNKLAQGEWVAIQKQAKAQMDVNTRSLGRMNTVSVQLGYQMQDVAASLASGINPLVIFAQQGGQVASAMSMMGGSVGKVASILGGIWVQAGLAAVVVLYQLFKSTKDTQKATVDLTDAESVRAAKLPDLIDKVKEFNKAQQESNNTERENLEIKGQALIEDRTDAYKKYAAQLKVVNTLNKQISNIISNPAIAAQSAISLGVLQSQLDKAKTKLADLKKVWQDIGTGGGEVQISQALKDAEGEVDDMAKIHTKYAEAQQRITDATRATFRWISQNVPLEKQAAERAKAQLLAKQLYLKALQEERREEEAITAAKKSGQETASFSMPVNGPITSKFGHRNAPLKADGTRGSTEHAGIDIGVPVGTPVRAPQVGVVESVGYSPTMGKYVILSHGGGTTTRYLHLSDTEGAQKGQRVEQGQEFAKSGNTGGVRAHLHYEVRVNGKPVDPTKGIFPIDTLKAEQMGFKDLETAGQRAANKAVEAVDTQIKTIQDDTSKSNDQQITEIMILENKRLAILKAAYGEDSKQYQQALQEKEAIRKRYAQLALREEIADLKQVTELQKTKESSSFEVQGQQRGQKEDAVDFMQQNGLISEREAVKEKAALQDLEYQQAVIHEDRMYQLQVDELTRERDLPGQTVARQNEINATLETEQAAHLGRMEVMQAGYARSVANINNQQASVTLNKWKSVTDTFTSSMGSAFQGLWTRSTTVSQALLNMADQQVFQLIGMGEQALEQYIMQEIAKRGAAQTTAAVTASAAATGAAASTTATAGAATSEITSNAAVAAAGAYKSTVVIPFIGPVAAPAAAALALAAVLGFASLISAKGGMGEVPDDQLAMVHKKEMILPAWIAEPLRASLKSPGGSSDLVGAASAAGSSVRSSQVNNNRKGDVNFNYQPQHTHQPAPLEQILSRDGATMRKWFRNEVRNGTLAPGVKGKF